jgi:lipopolysaccharide/colanic/teichoic acid biosynthesis glycosyltransferase
MLNSERAIASTSRWDVARSTKRGMDLGLAIVFLVLAAPVLSLVCILIKLEDRGPIFYGSARIGLYGSRIVAWKLRTMKRGADRWLVEHPEIADEYLANVKLENDPRVTRVGRFLRRYSIDEIPQLLNVLLGNMSLVGPRIALPIELPKLGDFVTLRQSVPPGITGMWQVSGRSLLTYEDKMRLDREYIEHWSLALDVLILIRTIPAVLSGRGAT